MPRIRIERINEGGNKVFGAKLLREELQIKLKPAKDIIDAALYGERPVFEVDDIEQAKRIVQQLRANGYDVGIVED